MKPKIVIIGAGFGGLSLAKDLRKAPVDVLLIDRNNYHTFQPLLYQVATAGLEAEEIASAVRGIFHNQSNFQFLLGEVTDIDRAAKVVILSNSEHISYDYLVLGAGATTNYFGVEGAEANSFSLKSLTDAVNLRSHLISCFERADQHVSLQDDGTLNMVVVGGGPTGVEMAGALCELIHKVFRKDFPHMSIEKAQVFLLEAGPQLLTPYHEKSQRYALKQLEKRGVQVMLENQVVRATATEVVLKSGQSIPTQTLIWAAGIRANPLVERLGLPTTRGNRIVVNEDLSLPHQPEIFAIGDIAACIDENGLLYPQVAPVAQQGAAHVAKQITLRLEGKPPTVFRYKDRGIMATIGRNAAVSELSIGLRNTGFIAWVMWLGLHLIQLIGFRNRLNVLLNWAWNYFTYDRSARLIMPAIDPDHEDTMLGIEENEPEVPVM